MYPWQPQQPIMYIPMPMPPQGGMMGGMSENKYEKHLRKELKKLRQKKETEKKDGDNGSKGKKKQTEVSLLTLIFVFLAMSPFTGPIVRTLFIRMTDWAASLPH